MADLSCGATMAKYILCLFNIIFFLCGVAILGVSLWLKLDDDASSYQKIIEFDRDNPSIDVTLDVLIAVGVLIFLVGFLGCCGAWKENSCMLTSYAGLVILVLLGQVAGVGCALYFKSKVDSHLESSMSKQAHNNVKNDTDFALTKAWYALQYHFECCGGEGYQDYKNSKYANESNTEVPPTCCKLNNTNTDNPRPADYATCQDEAKTGNTASTPQLYQKGCYSALIGWLKDNITIVVGVIFGIILIEIIGIIFACCVKKELTEYKKV